MEEELKAINRYIQEFCTCDGEGPLDAMSDLGNFERLSMTDLLIIKEILEENSNG